MVKISFGEVDVILYKGVRVHCNLHNQILHMFVHTLTYKVTGIFLKVKGIVSSHPPRSSIVSNIFS